MPATVAVPEIFPRSRFTQQQVIDHRASLIAAGAITSDLDAFSDPANFILVTVWNVIGGTDDTPSAIGLADRDVVAASIANDDNILALGTILMSEASIGNAVEQHGVGWTVLNRMTGKATSSVRKVEAAYSRKQKPTAAMLALAKQLLSSTVADPTDGATHFYSPISMPKKGEPTKGFDVKGGLELVPPLDVENFRPGWAVTMTERIVPGVRPVMYRFYADGPAAAKPAVPPAAVAVPGGGGPYLAADPAAFFGEVVGDGQCVAFVKAASGAPQTKAWRRGSLVKGDTGLAKGTAIATFDDDGTYGSRTDGTCHAAIYLGQTKDGAQVLDQFVGQAVHFRTLRFGGTPKVNDGNAFHVIL